MRSRFLTLSVSLLLAVLVGGADGCSSDPNVEGAKLDMNNGEYDRAITNINEALTTNPDNVDALILKNEIYLRQYEAAAGVEAKRMFLDTKFDDMIATVRRAETLAPENTDVRDARLNVWALAVNAGNNIVRDADADAAMAIPYLEAATELAPDSTQGFLSLGLAYFRTGDMARAVTPLERAIQIDENDPTLAYYYGRALLLADRGSEAVTALEAAQTRFPDDQDIQTMLLNAYTSTGQTEQALERYATAARAQADDPIIRYNYGALLLEAERFDEAIVELQAATRLAPDNEDAFYNLGAAYQNKAALVNARGNATEDLDAADVLFDERDASLNMAVAPLMQARSLAAANPEASEQPYCEALFRVYTQLNRIDDAEGVAECAGMSMN